MSTFQRLQKHFSRVGISLDYRDHIYHLHNARTEASVLMPEGFKLEAKAVEQLMQFAAVKVPGQSGHVCKACATPDFHPGTIAPVGSIVATTPDLVIPAAIGTDINCGMRLLATGVTLDNVCNKQPQLEQHLTAALLQDRRDVPVSGASFAALFDDGPEAWLQELQPLKQGIWQHTDFARLQREQGVTLGLDQIHAHSRYAPEAFLEDRVIMRPPSLGTTGSGNHFVELQVIDKIYDRHAAYAHGLRVGEVTIMIHSGSRDVGFYVGQRWMDRAKAAWPTGVKHPASGLYGLTGSLAKEYMLAMGVAARYAWANRVVLSELIRHCWQQVFLEDASRLVIDIPHNIVLPEHDMLIHRKGATPAHDGQLALIPGSMGDYSYVVSGLGNAEWLWSCSHGAGRSIRRQHMRARLPANEKTAFLPWHCITMSEARRIEEAPGAYKPVGPVIEAQTETGLITPVARFKPWMTFKA